MGTVVMMRISAQAAKASARLTSALGHAHGAQRHEQHEEDGQVAEPASRR